MPGSDERGVGHKEQLRDFACWMLLMNTQRLVRVYSLLQPCGFGINVPQGEHGGDDPATVQKIFDRGSLHYTVGMRCSYPALPLALWLFEPP